MCGFVGMWKDAGIDRGDMEQIKRMNQILESRGPDDEGYFCGSRLCLGFKRLSIIDLEKGSQPLSYDNGRFQIVLNGEIYNYIELREELAEEGYRFSTHSDTEVVLALYHRYGEGAVTRLRGMFAFAIWDQQEEVLFCARDPFGIKPFYYVQSLETLIFGSEKKSLLECLDTKWELDQDSLQHYLTFQYVPEPKTMLQGVHILDAGCTLLKKAGAPARMKSYWRPEFAPTMESFSEKVKNIRRVMEDSVGIHMRSDVPVGCFLSGGIDSTIIVALAKAVHPGVKAFSVGFEHKGFSEISLARETAEFLKVDHYTKVITSEEFMKELPRIVWHMDEPLADPAAIPLYFVSREAKKHVKVVLSGEGSDEFFGGYNIYREPNSLRIFDKIPEWTKGALNQLSHKLPEGLRGKSFLYRGTTPMERRYVGNANIFSQQVKSKILRNFDEELYNEAITKVFYEEAATYDKITKMQYIDINTWLKGDILHKADRMSMANSLELRVPFLDKEVFKVAATLKTEDKVNGKVTKHALREAFKDILPPHVTMRKKLGFPVPISHWLRDEMHDWAKDLIRESQTDEYLIKAEVERMLESHRKGEIDFGRRIWTVLMFMLWHRTFLEGSKMFDRVTVG
ncbi:asparagine synthase (glutamine-hydrolyzing) [Alkalibacter rhizosphaerae]|uniref:asparagine synthase (glutamine-hydrolyzing) n=1 Tax=Alkalibacter rhizosphaerae TaxID=2815577 RepID=A0A974XI66_9FIRM|nr:asparagine synthase (glutamine-hydrolyzing) [Alkalibacter rhizosphaerae]QSX09140.1 asparagine synthase (glutamine-hydrolyzing) [Alkalibacter rhizosphaerae]